MDWFLITPILAAAIRAGTPLVFAGLGELIMEKSGVLNLGLEGIMLISALTGFVTAYTTGSLTMAILAAALIGGIVSLLHGWICISLQGNQIVSGLAIAMFGTGLSGYLGTNWIGVAPKVSFSVVPIPLLSDIPWVGPILFSHNPMVYLSYLLAPTMAFFLYKTEWGLDVRACGENPEAADAMGLNISNIRYGCVFFGGMLIGLSGAYLSLAYTSMWVEKMSAGRGWIAIAIVIFSGWKPSRLVWGAYLFGGIEALQLRLQASGKFTDVPVYFLSMLPYIFTILVLLLAKIKKGGDDVPKALARPFSRESYH